MQVDSEGNVVVLFKKGGPGSGRPQGMAMTPATLQRNVELGQKGDRASIVAHDATTKAIQTGSPEDHKAAADAHLHAADANKTGAVARTRAGFPSRAHQSQNAVKQHQNTAALHQQLVHAMSSDIAEHGGHLDQKPESQKTA